ncbi:Regulation of nuclear pre-mRNA domain-containing protein 1B [Blattella germanica]|nr:Regulation of nuclear pre-mRNA domain-containing protein 1B [Blattella germanica]
MVGIIYKVSLERSRPPPQNSKKKGPEFGREFGNVLRKAFESMAVPENDEKTRKSIERILQIWEERGVYDPKLIREFKRGLEMSPPKKKVKVVEVRQEVEKPPKRLATSRSRSPIRERKKSENEVEVEVDGMKELHVTLSPRTPAGDPPEPEELIKALLVRKHLSLLYKATAEKLSVQVNEAVHLLTDYNSRLAAEMEYRKKLTTMLRDFHQAQKDLLAQAEQRLEEYNEKLQKVYIVRQEVKSHIQNLPDLTQLPDVTGGLAPLPSAGDLFNMH